MKYGVSTFKNSSLSRLKDKNTTSVGSDDLNLSSSTLGFTNDDCNDYFYINIYAYRFRYILGNI